MGCERESKISFSFSRFLWLSLGFFSLIIVVVIFSFNVSAAGCWQYTANSTCTGDSSCKWKSDNWGSWCEEFSCWSLYSNNECTTTSISGKNCTWSGGSTSYSCDQVSCWTYSGTTQSQCVNNTAGKSCGWSNSCYSSGSSNTGISCYNLNTQTSCLNTTGCSWGNCWDKGCSDYSAQSTCGAGKDWNGKNCTWETSSSGGWCTQNGCWKYANQTACGTASSTGLSCTWKWDSCQEAGCWSYDFTNASTCVNNTAGLGCTWSGNYCNTDSCWSQTSNSTCGAKTGCTWKSMASSGWCSEVSCWSWDSINGGSKSACDGNSSLYSLGCTWSGNPSGSLTSGWCYKDYSTTSCSNMTTEKSCMDTSYCWWEYVNWTNTGAGGACKAPTWGSGSFTNISGSILNDWNPECYMFDYNSTRCNSILGCNFTSSKCNELTNSYGTNITTDGIKCAYINESGLCNNVASLSSCCTWQNGTCADNKVSSSCYSNLKKTPNGEDECEDANSKSNCEAIASDPWYMPCKWDNSTDKCKFNVDEVFGNMTQSLIKIENKKNCEAAGGKWITENYCEVNVSVPSGRCEYKFDEEDNCNKACFACELKDSDGNTVNSSNAKDACLGSNLGFCEFKASTNAPNGIGFCNAKEEFKKGIAGNCDSNCGDCTFKGDSKSNDTTKKPSYYCSQSKANTLGGGCKWITKDDSDDGGYCVIKGEKTCEDSCDRCDTRDDCSNDGRTGIANQSGSCKWQGTDNDGACVSNSGGDVEICWNGEDDDDDGLVDCSDAGCYADSYCGLVSGDCFGWTTNATCSTNGCEWVIDKWGSWCDFKGSQCWTNDFNSTSCIGNKNCAWSNGTGTGWCERDWSVAEQCFAKNQSSCTGSCGWTVDTWCAGSGNSTDWCKNYGGWCDHQDFKSKDCWKFSTNSTCNVASGCSWKKDEWSSSKCEVDWSSNCWNYTSQSNCATNGCSWTTNNWGSWCESPMNTCYNQYNQTACSDVSGSKCTWRNQSWGASCEPSCYNLTSSDSCVGISGCLWKAEAGWCEEQQTQVCYNTTNTANENNCKTTNGCRWNNPGWCSPKDGGFSAGGSASGGGISTSTGGECWKYDGNQSYCTNKNLINISCGWSNNLNPTCSVNWNKDCWKYSTVAGGCNATNGCWFKNDSFGAWCMNVADQCSSNLTLVNNATLCNANAYCNATSYGCEATCYSRANQNDCAAVPNTACKWESGWCNSATVNDVFDNIESGEVSFMGFDECNGTETSQQSVDICGFGMKDMGDAYGFGVETRSFVNSSVCNNELLGYNSKVSGSGNETVSLFVYLDSDGSTINGCTLSHNSSAEGYEFKFRYNSIWNASKSKVVEEFNAYKCENSKWVATDIKINIWKKIMCNDIKGPMIALTKADLTKFPTLYDSAKDLRVYVSTIGNSGNITNPTDTAGPGWVTPGSIDFEITDAFSYGSDKAKFENILSKGFVEYENCFSSIDDDDDGTAGCNDWDCQYSSQCSGKGVNAAGYSDTSTPQVTGVKIEEYPDAALVMYDTNKPTNGTLEFYYNDSRCDSLNATVYDIGLLSTNVRDHKLWHTAEIYNGAGSLSYSLVNGTTYYYKLKVCDSNGKCAASKCSSFSTALSNSKCGFCSFVTRIKAGDSWKVSYDVNRDGTYEHVQGEVCGPNAGMKTNYTQVRRVNIKLSKSDGSAYFEFINSSLTKTGLNDKVRTISGSGAVIGSNNLVGLTSETKDKIINNLHPEVCNIKITSSSCTKLYHCDDSGLNCVDRTANATLIDSTNCVWQVPFCEFSTYRTVVSSGSDSGGSSGGSSGGGGGGGGGGAANKTSTTPGAGITGDASAGTGTNTGESNDTKQGTPTGINSIGKGVKNIIIVVVIVLILSVIVYYLISRRRLKY